MADVIHGIDLSTATRKTVTKMTGIKTPRKDLPAESWMECGSTQRILWTFPMRCKSQNCRVTAKSRLASLA